MHDASAPQPGGAPPPKPAQQLNVQAVQSNAYASVTGKDSSPQETVTMYSLFVSSIVSILSLQLARSHAAIPLNYRTFLLPSPPLNTERGDEPSGEHLHQDFCMLSLKVHLTTGGSLLISTSLASHTPYKRIITSLVPSRPDFLVRVAPSGLLARVISRDESMSNFALISQEPGPRKKSRTLRDQSIDRWKKQVISWLSIRGLELPGLDKVESWVTVQPGSCTNISISNVGHGSAWSYLWPAALCFYTQDAYTEWREQYTPSSGNTRTHSPYGHHSFDEVVSSWFAWNNRVGYRDPLTAAQDWLQGKSDRESATEMKRKARKARDETSQGVPTHNDGSAAFPASPLYSRSGAYGDMQAVGGVYPTPPDGVVGHGSATSGNVDTASAPAQAPIPQWPSSQPTNNGGATAAPSTMSAVVHLDGTRSTTTGNGDVRASSDDPHDDLFGSIGAMEDDFGASGVTDADFNFFDDEDMDGFDDMDEDTKEAVTASAQVLSEPNQDKLDKESVTTDAHAKADAGIGDTDHSMTGVKAETTVVSPAVQAIQSVPSDDKVEGVKLDAPTNGDVVQEDPDLTSMSSPPLEPSMIKLKLIGGLEQQRPPDTSSALKRGVARPGEYDVVEFNPGLMLSDQKYGAAGRFDYSSEQDKADFPHKPEGLLDLRLLKAHQSDVSKTPRKSQSASKMDSLSSIAYKPLQSDADIEGSSFSADGVSDAESLDSDQESSVAVTVSASQMTRSQQRSKRKRDLDDAVATPTSVATSRAEEGGLELLQQQEVEDSLVTDFAALDALSPGSSDWSLIDYPLPSTSPAFQAPKTIHLSESHPLDSSDLADAEWRSQSNSNRAPLSLDGRTLIFVAQILTDQLVSTTLDMFPNSVMESGIIDENQNNDVSMAIDASRMLQQTVIQLFPTAVHCDFLKYITTQDTFPDLPQPGKAQARPMFRRTNTGTDGSGLPNNALFSVASPHVRVRRADAMWDLLPPALSFWETLGLAPTYGPKNVTALCIYPAGNDLQHAAQLFLSSIGMVYENCRLGEHISETENGGQVAVTIPENATFSETMAAYREACVQLGKSIASWDMSDQTESDNFVVYIINPFDYPEAMWHICVAFCALFKAYEEATKSRSVSRPDVVLQIMPIRYIAAFDRPIILDPSTLIKLSREVYDRCPPSQSTDERSALSIRSAASVQLEEILPKQLFFKPVVDPPAALLYENSYMHVAYACSMEGNWITAAWTDNPGKHQATASYCTAMGRTFAEVAREIWQTTMDILQGRRVAWRLCIVRAGVMEKEEMDAWIALASAPSQLSLGTALFAFDSNPPLHLTLMLPSPTTTSTAVAAASTTAQTPGSTPQAGVSPDGLTPAPTPTENAATVVQDSTNDPDARLVDITDETWAVILQHRLSNSNSLVDYRPSLASGLLVKRGADANTPTSPQSSEPMPVGPIVVGINMLWLGGPAGRSVTISADGGIVRNSTPNTAQGNSNASTTSADGSGSAATPQQPLPDRAGAKLMSETFLRDLLVNYRGLGLLAKIKGMRGTKGGNVPWHIAAAVNGVKGLERCFTL